MSDPGQVTETTAGLDVERIGGIDRREIQFQPGMTLLAGENATNRTSTLQAIAAACGSDRATLKAGAEEGRVSLTIGSETYSRTLSRTGDGIRFGGDPYLEDATAATLFAFLLGDNEARRAVMTDGDLREIVMDPVDVDAIEQEIRDLQAELDAVEDQLDRRDRLRTSRLPNLRTERGRLQSEVGTATEELERKRRQLEKADRNVDESRLEREEVESTLSALQNAQNELQDVEADLEAERESLERTRDRLDDLQSRLDDIELPDADREELQRNQRNLWDEKERIDRQIEQLQTLIGFNEELLSGETTVLDAVESAVGTEEGDGDRVERITEQLAGGDTEALVCWTCGQQANRQQIEETLDTLRTYQQSLYGERDSIGERIEAVEEKLDRLEDRRAERERLVTERDETAREIDRTEQTITALQTRRDELEDRVDELEVELDELETDDTEYEAVIDLHKEVNRHEVRIESLEDELAEVESEIETVEAELDDLADLEEQEAQIQSEIEDRRTRIGRLERETIDGFNDHMDALLDQLAFENIERVWLEQTQRTEREGQRKVERSVFELHVVRSYEDGTVFEDSVRNLSESERNVVGLVFALAGYLAHEVHEQVPFMLLDSLEMIDGTRKARLLEYFATYPTYLVAVVLADELDPLLAEVEPDDVVEV